MLTLFFRTACLLAFSLCFCLPAAARGLETADPHASPAAKSLLRYWASLPLRKERRVISGQFIGHVQKESEPGSIQATYDWHVLGLHHKTEHWVAMVGVDYGLLAEKDEPVNLAATNKPLIAYWNRGGLVTVSWHARNPWTGGNARDNTVDGHFSDLFKPGTPVHKVWMAELDQVAEALAELQAAGVVVLWRPFHESNGRSFWWAQPRSSKEQKELWRHMFRYFTGPKGLHNLLWVYSALPKRDAKRAAEDHGFPGKDVVDMVGLDVYVPSFEIDQGYERLRKAAPGKPFWLTEFGPRKTAEQKKNPSAKEDPHYDYTELIRTIQEKYPEIAGFQAWNRSWSLSAQKNAGQLLEDPWVITLESLDWKADKL